MSTIAHLIYYDGKFAVLLSLLDIEILVCTETKSKILKSNWKSFLNQIITQKILSKDEYSDSID